MQTTSSRPIDRPDPAPDDSAPPATSPTARYVLAGVLATASLAMIAVFGDVTMLTAIGYLPILIVKAIATGSKDIQLLWQPELLQSVLTLGATIALAVAAYRALPQRPIFRDVRRSTVTRIRSISVAIAIIVPTGYAITRLAWFFGIPLGVSGDFLEEVDVILVNGAGLAAFALVGAVLTWGLTRPWGVTFPRWMPWARGHRVPIGLARNSAVIVGFIVLSAGGYFIRSIISGDISIAPDGAESQLAAWLPEIFWPLWGLGLIAAGLAYAELRRRDEAPHAAAPVGSS